MNKRAIRAHLSWRCWYKVLIDQVLKTTIYIFVGHGTAIGETGAEESRWSFWGVRRVGDEGSGITEGWGCASRWHINDRDGRNVFNPRRAQYKTYWRQLLTLARSHKTPIHLINIELFDISKKKKTRPTSEARKLKQNRGGERKEKK